MPFETRAGRSSARRTTTVIAASCLVFSACAHVYTDAEILRDFRENGLARAAFEMNCDPAQVQASVLHAGSYNRLSRAQVGAAGCDHRLVYVHEGSWLLNSSSNASPTPPASPQPRTPTAPPQAPPDVEPAMS